MRYQLNGHGLGQTALENRIPSGYTEIAFPAGSTVGSAFKVGDLHLIVDEPVVIGGSTVGTGSMLVEIVGEQADRFLVKEIAREGSFPPGFVVDHALKSQPLSSTNHVYRYTGVPWQTSHWITLAVGLGLAGALGVGIYLSRNR